MTEHPPPRSVRPFVDWFRASTEITDLLGVEGGVATRMPDGAPVPFVTVTDVASAAAGGGDLPSKDVTIQVDVYGRQADQVDELAAVIETLVWWGDGWETVWGRVLPGVVILGNIITTELEYGLSRRTITLQAVVVPTEPPDEEEEP